MRAGIILLHPQATQRGQRGRAPIDRQAFAVTMGVRGEKDSDREGYTRTDRLPSCFQAMQLLEIPFTVYSQQLPTRLIFALKIN